MERIAPGRWAECRPVTALTALKATTVLSLPLTDVAAKIRNAPPIDDEEDYSWPVWAGVVPVKTVAGTPEPDPRLAEGVPVPDYAARFEF